MTSQSLRGVFPILVTPFDDRGRIDEESLRSVVEYNLAAGVDGLGIALGSEIFKLIEAERDRVIATVIDQTRGRVPVVVNTGAAATDPAVFYSQQAENMGAAAVMCTPPASGISAAGVRSYFKAISDAIRIPIFIQDTPTTPVAAPLIRRIAEESQRARYAKVESVPAPKQIDEAVRHSDGLVAIFGGGAGMCLLEELRRGSVGTMPWPSTPEAFVRVWKHWQAGEVDEAREAFEHDIAPLTRIGAGGGALGFGHLIHKEVLRRRGIIRSAHVRGPVDALDEITLRELDEVCERLEQPRRIEQQTSLSRD